MPGRRRKNDDSSDEDETPHSEKPLIAKKKGNSNDGSESENDDNSSDKSSSKKSEKGSGRKGKGMKSLMGKFGKNKKKNDDKDGDDSSDEDRDVEKGNSKKKHGKSKSKKKSDSSDDSMKSGRLDPIKALTDGLQRFIPSDKDVKGKPLHISEAPGYVKIDFGDGTGPIALSELNSTLRDVEDEKAPGKLRNRQIYVYVESASTGRFFKYATDTSETLSTAKDNKKSKLLMNVVVNEEDFEKSREAAMERLERLMYSGFLVLQGVLAGYSGETVYEAYSGDNAKEFVAEYGALANETRRLYYIMTTICFVGAMNDFSRVRHNTEEWRKRSGTEKIELVFLVVCYMAALVFSLIAGVSDIEFYYYTVEDRMQFSDAELEEKVSAWKIYNLGRFLSCVIGWFVVCRVQHRNSARAADAVRESYNLSEALETSHRRIAQLTGVKLDKMSREELLELVSMQRNGLEQTEHVLENLPNQNKDVFAPETPKTVSQGGASSTFNPMTGLAGGPATPSRSRVQSMLPASISAKAPPSIITDMSKEESPV